MESLKEQLVLAKTKGEESAAYNLQVQLEKVVSKQMEILHNSGYERLPYAEKCQSTGHYIQNSKENSTMALDCSDSQVERPLNLRMSNYQSRQLQQVMSDGEQHLGHQICNELSRLYTSSETNSECSNTVGILKDYSQAALNSTEKKIIKLEPEETR
ncbi:hypothetical protein GDO86_020580 [Hymenochirus boettgeri]|uniref:Nab1 C-terminal domain-containing protein n=1 Tax=Hymenochirus boettgeri TaxID=247094 RepID=A0A8T2IIR5_9PIPI|nr:hypothetical protein GDO86_020580 [Hymenochirus boettgeri]